MTLDVTKVFFEELMEHVNEKSVCNYNKADIDYEFELLADGEYTLTKPQVAILIKKVFLNCTEEHLSRHIYREGKDEDFDVIE